MPEIIKIDFTKEKITPSTRSVFLSFLSRKLDLPQKLKESIKLKKRNRKDSDKVILWSLIYSLAQGVKHWLM